MLDYLSEPEEAWLLNGCRVFWFLMMKLGFNLKVSSMLCINLVWPDDGLHYVGKEEANKHVFNFEVVFVGVIVLISSEKQEVM